MQFFVMWIITANCIFDILKRFSSIGQLFFFKIYLSIFWFQRRLWFVAAVDTIVFMTFAMLRRREGGNPLILYFSIDSMKPLFTVYNVTLVYLLFHSISPNWIQNVANGQTHTKTKAILAHDGSPFWNRSATSKLLK